MCNGENKKDKWPESGYVDPCAIDITERPEQYFDYDADTGEIVPKNSLSGTARWKASNTINDLGLNRLDVRFFRFEWTRKLREDLLLLPIVDRQALVEYINQQPVEYAGVTELLIEQLRRDGHI